MYQVFISHSSEDRDWANEACRILEQRQVKCWIAPRDITPGTEWGEAIIEGIDQSRVMVLIFSDNANQSPQVRREVERAIGKSMPVLPLRIEDIRPKGALEFALSNTHWLDAFVPPAEDRLALMAEAVESLLGLKKNTKPDPKSITASPISAHHGRGKWIVVALLGLAVTIGSVAAYSYFGNNPKSGLVAKKNKSNEQGDSDLENDKNSTASAQAVDETSLFQGIWEAIDESVPSGAVLNKAKIRARDFTITVRDHSFTHRRNPTETDRESLFGSISFIREGNTKTFTMYGKAATGEKVVWLGVYDFKDNALELCFRQPPDRVKELVAPPKMMDKGQPGTYYVKLVRARRPNKDKKN